ncbi:MAG TPA: beta-ketoacyl-ACP synthase 3, partial [Streptosporangiaceae bacterium]
MRLHEGSAGARVLAFGGYQPARVVTNDDLAETVETSDEWIRSRVGIASRRIAGPDETVADMAVAAAGKALAGSGLSPADIDLVIVATCTPEVMIPNTAAVVARRLGISAPGAYDLNAACAGFCYALAAASDAVRAGSARHVLVIGAEKLSQWVDWTDRSTCIIFADGAGAAVVGPAGPQPGPPGSEQVQAEQGQAEQAEPGIGPVVWGSDGDMADKIYIKDRNSFIFQEGQA